MIPREVNVVIPLPCHHFIQSCMNALYFHSIVKSAPQAWYDGGGSIGIDGRNMLSTPGMRRANVPATFA